MIDPEEIKTEISGIQDDVEVKELEKDEEGDMELDSDVGKKYTEGKVKERRRRKQRVERV